MNVSGIVAIGRRLANDGLIDSAVVYDRSAVADGHGGETFTYTARPAEVRCAVLTTKDTPLANEAGLLQGPQLSTILMPYGTEVPEGSRLVVAGVTFEVVSRLSAESDRTVVERFVGRAL
jgi:hypothetical protein